jgi:CubicO group peptidase (beta-lactamase class C family)
MKRRDFVMATMAAPVFMTVPANAAVAPEMGRLLTTQMEGGRIAPGIVAGVLDGGGRNLFVHGSAENDRALDGDTVFQIASLTKVFTALLLTEMAMRGEVRMEDPVAEYLPAEARMPVRDGRPVRLIDIVTYASGLPGWPANMPGLDPAKPFPAYEIASLYAALTPEALKYVPGTHYEYSNFGYGLLAHALSRRGGTSFEALVLSRICVPLGMANTRIMLPPSLQARRAQPHDDKLQPVGGWSLPEAFAGAGGLSSTANDLLNFLEAATGRRKTALDSAFAMLLAVRRPADAADTQAMAGWFVSARDGSELIWKDGATVGYSSFLGYNPQNRDALILLTNGQRGDLLTPLGKHLLDAKFPLPGR